MTLGHQIANHVLNVVAHALQTGTGEHADHRLAGIFHINLDGFLLQFPLLQTLAHPFTPGLILRLCGLFFFFAVIITAAKESAQRIGILFRFGNEHIQNAFFRHFLRLILYGFNALLAHHAHGSLGKVTDNGFHIPAHIAYFGELSSFYLDKRSLDQFCQTAGNLRLADTCGTNHQNVLGHHIFLHFLGQLTAAPAVAQGNSHGFFCFILANDIFIEFLHNLAWSLFVCSKKFFHLI